MSEDKSVKVNEKEAESEVKSDILSQKDNKAFHEEAKARRKEATQDRKKAVGLLTPKLLEKHLSKKQELVLQYGKTLK